MVVSDDTLAEDIYVQGRNREISSSRVEMSGLVWAWHLLYACVVCASWGGSGGMLPQKKFGFFRPFLVHFRG